MNNIEPTDNRSIFEKAKQISENGLEYWNAREIQIILQYNSWDKFLNVIEKAKDACRNSGHNPDDHFSHMGKMVDIGSGAQRKTIDIRLSRYACYLKSDSKPFKGVRKEK